MMTPDFSPSYFEDEVREGFFISSMMKRYRASQLRVLSEIDKVCVRHGIRWFADNGTLLGAVRHGGYIPWDDDLDISMLRHDYERFLEVAGDELPGEYRVLTLRTESEYTEMLGRVVNAGAIDYSDKHLREYYGCPYTAGVDIFPLDGLYPDDEREEERRNVLIRVSEAVGLIESGRGNTAECERLLISIGKKSGVVLRRGKNILRELLLLSERIYAEYPSDEAEYVALMPYWVTRHNHKYRAEWFKESVSIPFENVSLPVPAMYDEVLKVEYGDYMSVRKDMGVHAYPVYGEQEEIYGRVRGEYPFKYAFNKNTYTGKRDITPFKDKCAEITDTLDMAQGKIRELCAAGDLRAELISLLEGAQNLAVSLGTYIEKRTRDIYSERGRITELLEKYCEDIYVLYSSYDEMTEYDMEKHLNAMESELFSVRETLIRLSAQRKREVLILACKEEWWVSLEPLWRELRGDAIYDVYTVPVPYTVRDITGNDIGRTRADYKRAFPPYVDLISPEDYDITSRHPDIIITQYPYDELNDALVIPDKYYSRNLIKHTDELIYVPWVITGGVSDDPKLAEALKYIIEQPAVVYADKVYLYSDEMRELYVHTLTERVKDKEYWSGKISVNESLRRAYEKKLREDMEKKTERRSFPASWNVREGKKLLLFSVNASFVMEYGSDAIKKINEALDTILEASDKITCVFSPGYDTDDLMRERVLSDDGIASGYEDIIKRVSDDDRIIYDKERLAGRYLYGFAGFYGNEGEIAHDCADARVPVMLMRITDK